MRKLPTGSVEQMVQEAARAYNLNAHWTARLGERASRLRSTGPRLRERIFSVACEVSIERSKARRAERSSGQ